MNGDTAMPTLTFSGNCDYGVLDSILHRRPTTTRYGWAVRIWLKQGVILTAQWGYTEGQMIDGVWVDQTALRVWSETAGDYVKEIRVSTDDITRLEVL